jgi:hypothetical protein
MKNKYPKIFLAFSLFIPIVLLLLPSTFFDSGDSVCMSVVFFDRECYACGMTRAIQHLIHLDFAIAFEYNRISFLALPLLVFIYLKDIKKLYFLIKKK